MPDTDEDNEIAHYMQLSEDSLYAELAAPNAAFDFSGRVAAGREALADFLKASRGNICDYYMKNKGVIRDASDLVRVLSEGLKLVIAVSGYSIPVIPAAVLLFKIGIEKLCPAS